MCEEYWEREAMRRIRLLAAEDELRWRNEVEEEVSVENLIPLPAPVPEEKRRATLVLSR